MKKIKYIDYCIAPVYKNEEHRFMDEIISDPRAFYWTETLDEAIEKQNSLISSNTNENILNFKIIKISLEEL